MVRNLLNLTPSNQYLSGKQWFKNTAIDFNFIAGKQVYIISYPKSGRTWLRVLLGKILCDHFDIDEKWLLNTYKVTRLAKVLSTKFTHDNSELKKEIAWHELTTDKTRYRKKKVVLIIRDPKDLIVSSYFHATKRIHKFSKSLPEFIRSPKYGIRKIMNFYKIWYDQQTIPKDFLLIRYEEMHQDTVACIRSVLEFIETTNIPEQVINNAIEFCQFENMKQLERSGEFKSKVIQPTDPMDNESYKVRRGKVGGYRDYLSQEDIDFIDQIILESGNPFLYK